MMLSHTSGKLYRPPSLLRLGLRALMYMASFTPLSNHLGFVVNTSVFSNSMECWWWSTWMCLETSEVVELGRRCSLNLAFRDLSVSPMYTTSHSSHLILYISPTTFSLLTGSFSFTNYCRSVFVGLKYVGMPYFPKTQLICSENPFTYGIMTGIFFDFSFIEVSNVSPDVSTSVSTSFFQKKRWKHQVKHFQFGSKRPLKGKKSSNWKIWLNRNDYPNTGIVSPCNPLLILLSLHVI